MVDIIGRAWHLEEAKLWINSMLVDPCVAASGALLDTSRYFGNVEYGELVAEQRFKLEPKNASADVLHSDIYAIAKEWEEVMRFRESNSQQRIK